MAAIQFIQCDRAEFPISGGAQPTLILQETAPQIRYGNGNFQTYTTTDACENSCVFTVQGGYAEITIPDGYSKCAFEGYSDNTLATFDALVNNVLIGQDTQRWPGPGVTGNRTYYVFQNLLGNEVVKLISHSDGPFIVDQVRLFN